MFQFFFDCSQNYAGNLQGIAAFRNLFPNASTSLTTAGCRPRTRPEMACDSQPNAPKRPRPGSVTDRDMLEPCRQRTHSAAIMPSQISPGQPDRCFSLEGFETFALCHLKTNAVCPEDAPSFLESSCYRKQGYPGVMQFTAPQFQVPAKIAGQDISPLGSVLILRNYIRFLLKPH